VLIGLMPGDPIDLMAAGNPHMTPEDAQRLRALYGLDQPLVTRYWRWLTAALSGDLGYSRLYNVPVLEVIGPRALHTLSLLGTALVLTIAIAVPLGVYAARSERTLGDRLVNAFCLAGISVPAFWLALLMICLFSVVLGWLPAGATLSEGTLIYRLKSLILPVLTITLSESASYVRHTRRAMIDALKADHIRTARAKGCTEGGVVWGHAFRTALPPIVTLLMLD
jgi:peptide/nickel transport system permease protein